MCKQIRSHGIICGYIPYQVVLWSHVLSPDQSHYWPCTHALACQLHGFLCSCAGPLGISASLPVVNKHWHLIIKCMFSVMLYMIVYNFITLANILSLELGSLEVVTMIFGSSTPAHLYSSSICELTPGTNTHTDQLYEFRIVYHTCLFCSDNQTSASDLCLG